MLLIAFIILQGLSAVDQTNSIQHPVDSIDLGLVNPRSMVLNEGLLLIYDAGPDRPFVLYDSETGEVIRFGSRGRGPGEIQSIDNELSMALMVIVF